MAVKLVIADDYNDMYAASPVITQLRGRCEITVYTEMIRSVDDVVARIGGAEIVVANRERTPLNAEVFQHVPTLRLIAQTGMRGAHLDLPAATQHGILVAGTGGSQTAPSSKFGAASTVEMTIGLMLAAARRIPYGDAEVRAGRWSQFVGQELAGRKLGIVGFGRIGSRVGKIAQAIGMDVLAWSPNMTPERAAAAGVTACSLDELMSEADVVSVHLQLTSMSRGLINRERLALMKSSALLVNTARGPIVDEAALLEMLQDGRLAGAALDVFGQEPLPAGHPLFSLPNVVLTPHVGWVAQDSYVAFFEGIVENVTAYLDGRPIPRMVNPEALDVRRSG
jgi:phosphoglycerate dehydrogenase-like enzyme